MQSLFERSHSSSVSAHCTSPFRTPISSTQAFSRIRFHLTPWPRRVISIATFSTRRVSQSEQLFASEEKHKIAMPTMDSSPSPTPSLSFIFACFLPQNGRHRFVVLCCRLRQKPRGLCAGSTRRAHLRMVRSGCLFCVFFARGDVVAFPKGTPQRRCLTTATACLSPHILLCLGTVSPFRRILPSSLASPTWTRRL